MAVSGVSFDSIQFLSSVPEDGMQKWKRYWFVLRRQWRGGREGRSRNGPNSYCVVVQSLSRVHF